MRLKVQYKSLEQREELLEEYKGMYLIMEENIVEGNFLVFTTEKPLIVEVDQLRDDLQSAVLELSTLIAMGGIE